MWFKAGAGDLYTWSRTDQAWQKNINEGNLDGFSAYAEMSLDSTTSTISFAATTAAPVEGLTAGLMSGFSMLSDSGLTYTGTGGRFLIQYSASLTFAEAANVISGWPIISGVNRNRGKFSQTIVLTTDRSTVSGSVIVNLVTGNVIRFLCVPSAHTGTDILTLNQFRLNVTQLR